jgi:TolB-like protein
MRSPWADGPNVQARARKTHPEVFVCYAHEDAVSVREDLEFLAGEGVTLWYDDDISGGSHWRAEVGEALDRASHVLFYVSRDSVASDHCNREVNYALDQRKTVVPVRLDATQLTADLRLGLNRVQTIVRSTLPRTIYRERMRRALGLPEAAPTAAPGVPRDKLRSRWLPASAGVVALAAIVVWWAGTRGPDPDGPTETLPARTSGIVVLPFAFLGTDQGQEYLSTSLWEELVGVLAAHPELRVISRATAFHYRDRDLDTPTLAAELDVTHMLEGSVRCADDTVRLAVQLIDARSDRYLWSRAYDRPVGSVFAVQDDIAVEVFRRLELSMPPEPAIAEQGREEQHADPAGTRHLLGQQPIGVADHLEGGAPTPP